MADQILVFKNGERVITELQEVFEGEEENKRGVCLLMTNPYILELVGGDDPNSAMDLQVKFSKWCPYSVDYQFRIPYDAVLAIGEPDTGLDQAYRSKIESLVAAQQAGRTDENPLEGWAQGEMNPNMEAQLADIKDVSAADNPTAGVAGNTAEHPIAEPVEVVEGSAETSEV